MDTTHSVEELNALIEKSPIKETLQKGASFFCTCDDHKCAFNPCNPKNAGSTMGCDGCIVKNLKQGEVPSCIFRKVGDISEWEDFTIAGFVRFCRDHGIEG